MTGRGTRLRGRQLVAEGRVISKAHSRSRHVDALLRLDHDRVNFPEGDLTHGFTVKKVFFDRAVAEAEVRRLSEVNGEMGCEDLWQTTPLVSDRSS